MVTRKPVPTRANDPPPSAPYPTSPVAASVQHTHAPAYQSHDNDLSLQRSRSSSVSSHNTWNSGFSSDHDDNDDHEHGQQQQNLLPDSLRVGPPTTPSQQSFQSHNPYHNIQNQSQTSTPPYGAENIQAIWDSVPAQPTAPPPPPPPAPAQPPTAPFASLSLNQADQNNLHAANLELPPEIPQKSSRRSLTSQASSSNNPWQQDLDREQQIQNAFKTTPSPRPQPDNLFQPPPGPPPSRSPHSVTANDYVNTLPVAPPAPPLALNRRDVPTASSPPSMEPQLSNYEPPAPPAPPKPMQPSTLPSQPPLIPPIQASEPLIDFSTEDTSQPQVPNAVPVDAVRSAGITTVPAVPAESPEEQLKKQRNETYQIKLINWFDASSGPSGSMRRSPILMQNANGPCPLLALVNALSLSAPESPKTVLVETLYSREQISLGLLLDAVFEELARRSEVNHKVLPDVGDLYSFLITLHTGMNVNPRFVGATGTTQETPGSFEETKELRLYSTFDIPLVHGWIPPSHSPAYEAFDRSAKTFDTALEMQFAQSELEDKLGTDGLSSTEQQMFEDIIFMKEFLHSYPTQLTEHGLEIIRNFLRPGQIAILFRNDHFSTLYKQERTGTLMNLVTDAGYSSHDEVVWESLVDVNGAACGLFSGDFRPIGNSSSSATASGQGEGWQTVPPRNNRTSTTSGAALAEPPRETHGGRKTSEQEDADLALALQLQEEEEDRQRREQAARRRQEDELSRQFLDREAASAGQNSTGGQRPAVPPRRSNVGNTGANATASSNNPPPTADAPYIRGREDADDEPPSYEQAASDRPFRPPGATPVQRQGDALGALNALQMQNSAFSASQNAGHSPQAPSMHRRRSSTMGLGRTNSNSNSQRLRRQLSQGQGAAPQYSGYVPPANGRMSQAEREERCVVM